MARKAGTAGAGKQTTTGEPKIISDDKPETSTTGNSRQIITQSNTQVVSGTETKNTNAQPQTQYTVLGKTIPTHEYRNIAPYAKTQNRKFISNSQSQIAKSELPTNKAQPQNFLYAVTKSGNYFIVPINLSLQLRAAYHSQGIKLTSVKPTTATFSVDAGTDVIVDPNLANTDIDLTDRSIGGGQNIGGGGKTGHTVTKKDDGFEDNQKPDVEQSEESNDVELSANTGNSENATTDPADENYNHGHTLTHSDDSPLAVELLKDVKSQLQYMQQFNENTVPTPTYDAFANNGKNGANGVFTNGTGSASMQMGYENLKGSIGNIMQSRLFPIVVIGIIVLLVISFLRPKAAIAQLPTKVINF